VNPDNNTQVLQSDVLECDEDQTVKNRYNDYGLTDQDISKRKWQIVVGDTSIEASFTVTINATLSSNVGGVIEVTATLYGVLSGNLTLSLGTEEMLSFSTWLIALTNVFNTNSSGHINGFFEASATFDGSFNAVVAPKAPFDFLGIASASGGFAEPYVIDFLGNTSYPNITFDVVIDGIGDVRKLSFAQVVAILSDALEFLVGDADDDSVDSCSGGFLGKEEFTYQLPGTLFLNALFSSPLYPNN